MKKSFKNFMLTMVCGVAVIFVSCKNPASSNEGNPTDNQGGIVVQPGLINNSEEICEQIRMATENRSLELTGEIDASVVLAIKSALSDLSARDNTIRIELDMSNANGLKTFPNNAFSFSGSNYQALKSCSLPSGITSMGYMTFNYCKNLEYIVIPDTVESIDIGTFYVCSSLETVNYPKSITQIFWPQFSDCPKIKSVTFDSDNPKYKSIDGVVFLQDGKTLYCYPCGKTGNSYTVPESVTCIGPFAFYKCVNLKTITVPANLNKFGLFAFSSDSLNTIKFKGTETKWNSIKRIDELEQDVDDEMEANEFLGVKDSVEVKFNQ